MSRTYLCISICCSHVGGEYKFFDTRCIFFRHRDSDQFYRLNGDRYAVISLITCSVLSSHVIHHG